MGNHWTAEQGPLSSPPGSEIWHSERERERGGRVREREGGGRGLVNKKTLSNFVKEDFARLLFRFLARSLCTHYFHWLLLFFPPGHLWTLL